MSDTPAMTPGAGRGGSGWFRVAGVLVALVAYLAGDLTKGFDPLSFAWPLLGALGPLCTGGILAAAASHALSRRPGGALLSGITMGVAAWGAIWAYGFRAGGWSYTPPPPPLLVGAAAGGLLVGLTLGALARRRATARPGEPPTARDGAPAAPPVVRLRSWADLGYHVVVGSLCGMLTWVVVWWPSALSLVGGNQNGSWTDSWKPDAAWLATGMASSIGLLVAIPSHAALVVTARRSRSRVAPTVATVVAATTFAVAVVAGLLALLLCMGSIERGDLAPWLWGVAASAAVLSAGVSLASLRPPGPPEAPRLGGQEATGRVRPRR